MNIKKILLIVGIIVIPVNPLQSMDHDRKYNGYLLGVAIISFIAYKLYMHWKLHRAHPWLSWGISNEENITSSLCVGADLEHFADIFCVTQKTSVQGMQNFLTMLDKEYDKHPNRHYARHYHRRAVLLKIVEAHRLDLLKCYASHSIAEKKLMSIESKGVIEKHKGVAEFCILAVLEEFFDYMNPSVIDLDIEVKDLWLWIKNFWKYQRAALLWHNFDENWQDQVKELKSTYSQIVRFTQHGETLKPVLLGTYQYWALDAIAEWYKYSDKETKNAILEYAELFQHTSIIKTLKNLSQNQFALLKKREICILKSNFK